MTDNFTPDRPRSAAAQNYQDNQRKYSDGFEPDPPQPDSIRVQSRPTALQELFGKFKLIKRIGIPLIFLASLIVFVTMYMSDGVKNDLFTLAEHMVLIIMLGLFGCAIAIFSCYYLFDGFLSFREFNEAIEKWKKGKATDDDLAWATIMGKRSGEIFKGFCLIIAAVIIYRAMY